MIAYLAGITTGIVMAVGIVSVRLRQQRPALPVPRPSPVLSRGLHYCYPPSPTGPDGTGLSIGAWWRCPKCRQHLKLTHLPAVHGGYAGFPERANRPAVMETEFWVWSDDGATWQRQSDYAWSNYRP